MNRFRNFILWVVLIALTAAALVFINRTERRLDDAIDREQLRFSGTVADAPPMVAFTTVALGSFRGLLADILWLRSENLKAKHNYFEMVQLARWITDLQPNYSGGTAYLAWNLAYNVSVTSSNWEDRWYWVNEGIRLIRDKALVYNPDDPVLYREMAWIYFHKLGNVLDDANLYYKNQLAQQMTNILGSASPDLETLAAAPATEAEFMKRFPPGSPLWKAAAELGCRNYAELYDLFRKPIPAALPAGLKNAVPEADFAVAEAALRRRLLKERLGLDPAKMTAIDRKYGKMDWRVPESQAIYWADLGWEKSGERDIQCIRIVTQAMQAAFRGGRLLTLDTAEGAYIQVAPNLALADAAFDTYVAAQKKFGNTGGGESFRSARINYLKDAIPLIYVNGGVSKAEEFFRKLIKEDGPQKQKTLDEFVMVEFAEDVRDADVKKASAIISGLIRRSILNLVYGDHDAAVANERLARYIYRRYSQDNRDIKRNTLPPYAKLKENVVGESRNILPPAMVRLLDAAIAAERAETAGSAGGTEKK